MDYFFKPQSVALVGASKTKTKVGYNLWQKLKVYGKKLYLVNPRFGYSRVSDINAPVDLAVIAVPAPAVPSVVDDCVRKKVKAVIVISSGFAELGETGIKLKSPPLPLLGPNCFGLANPKIKLDTTFAKAVPPPGNIGLISQSGALASFLFNWAKEEGLGFSKFVSLGNRLNLNENDFLDYFSRDPETKVIALYLESFAGGSEWLRLASRVSRTKPIVVLFGGQTIAGSQASLSHTASLSPPSEVVTSALKQSGCLAARDLTDFSNLLEVFSLEPDLKDNDLAIITNAGGPAILATDTAASLTFDVAKPIDVLGDALAERFQQAFATVSKDKTKDAFLIIITPQANTQIAKTCQAIVKRFKGLKKPVVVSLLGGQLLEPARKILKTNRIATIDLPQEAAEGLAALLKFHRLKKHALYPVRRSYKIKEKTLGLTPGRLTWQQAERLTRQYQIPLVKTVVLDRPVKPASLNWPLVLKADPALAQHRTENKAIYLNIRTHSSFKLAFKRLKTKFPLILAQEQIVSGHELFIGLRREPGWPALLTIGGGGVYTELYQDLARSFLPVNESVVSDLLRQTRIGQIISGYRTDLKLALKPTLKLILNCCHLIEDYPQIKELEINPALISESNVAIVDLKVTSSTLPEVKSPLSPEL